MLQGVLHGCETGFGVEFEHYKVSSEIWRTSLEFDAVAAGIVPQGFFMFVQSFFAAAGRFFRHGSN